MKELNTKIHPCPTPMNNCNHKQNFLKLIQSAASRYDTWTVFSDFLLMAATVISNSVDKRQYEYREKQYMQTVSKYEKKELALFPQMLSELTLALQGCAEEKHPQDILGEAFHDLEFHNKWKGQFFSPTTICDFMGKISIGEQDKVIEKHGYVTVNEPACGGGAMLFGFMTAFAERGYNYCKQMLVEAVDIDLKCVHMAYIQLSLYGIPAVVLHQNSISLETWSAWYTPVYILDDWTGRRKMRKMTDIMGDMIKKPIEVSRNTNEIQNNIQIIEDDRNQQAAIETLKQIDVIEEFSLF